MPQAAALERLRRLLLIQCQPDEAARLRPLAERQATGFVLTGEQALATAQWLSDRGFRGPLLCDRARYSGKLRRSARSGLDGEWIRRQLELSGVALTDSGYLAVGDWGGLSSVLEHASAYAQPVIALLPLQARWFESEADVQRLAELIVAAGVPVAVVLEHARDPFGVRYVLRGFLRLLDELRSHLVPLLLLRSDHSALGALGHGAFAGAVGTRPSLRHAYPAKGYRPPRGAQAVFVPSLLAHHGLRRVRELTEAAPDLGGRAWECDCAECDGLEVRMLSDAALVRHSLSAQLDKCAELMRLHPGQPPHAWREACGHALFLYRQLAELRTGLRPPAALHHWADSAPDSPEADLPVLDRTEHSFETYRADRPRQPRPE